jgi:hypothetical protein
MCVSVRQLFIVLICGSSVITFGAACKKPSSPTGAGSVLFEELFDGTSVSTNRWSVTPGDGEVLVSGGTLRLSAPPGQFPFLVTRGTVFPSAGDFSISVRLKYASAPEGGTGFGADWPANEGVRVWQDFNSFFAMCGTVSANLTRGDLDYHVFEWRYVGSNYSLLIDGVLATESDYAGRPSSLYLGHAPLQFGGRWTSLECDYVRVVRL